MDNNKIAIIAKELVEVEREFERWNEEMQYACDLMMELEKREDAARQTYNEAQSECTLLKNRMRQLKEELRLAVYDGEA